MKTIFESYPVEKIEQIIQDLFDRIRRGEQQDALEKYIALIAKKFSETERAELLSMAKARVKNTKTSRAKYYTQEDLRFATPDVVADYRAERLRCATLVEIGCGVGFQTLAFAKTCMHVFALDIDERKIAYARENAAACGISNVSFLCADALDKEVIKRISSDLSANIVFVDTERLPTEKERTIESIVPSIPAILEKYLPLMKGIAIEVPPQLKEISFDCEKEYLSIDGKLNRLTLFFGSAKRCARSVVSLPSVARITNEDSVAALKLISAVPVDAAYIGVIDETIVVAHLLDQLNCSQAFLFQQNKKYFLISQTPVQNPFVVWYRSVASVATERELLHTLRQKKYGSVLFHGSFDPQKYGESRRKIERELSGTKRAALFLFEKIIVAEKVL